MSRSIYGLLAISMLLVPFSTPAGEQSVVVSFAMPFLAIFAFLFLCWFISQTPGIPTRLMPLLGIAAFYVTWIVICALVAPSPVRSLGRALVNVFGLLILLHSASSPSYSAEGWSRTVSRYLKLSIISGCILSAYYILTFTLAVIEHGLAVVVAERWVGGLYALPWGASNTIAACLLFPVIATVVSTVASDYRAKLLVALVVLAAGIAISLSRNAAFCLFLYLISAALVLRHYWVVVWLSIAALGLGVVLIEYMQALDAAQSSLTRFVDPQNLSRGFGHRVELWIDRLPLLASHLLEPIGYYGSLEVFGESSHNALITTVLEQGVIGIILFVVLVLEVARQLIRSSALANNSQERSLLLLGLAITLLNLQFEDPHFTQVYIVYWWFYLGICVMASTDSLQSRSA
jgi:hypothetical protein